MDKQYSWKRTDETEIDLADLLARLCRQWKRVLLSGILSALLLGGYGWVKGREADVPLSDIAEKTELTETEEQAVEDAVRLKNEIQGLEAYLNGSVLMQIDPYHKSRVTMLCAIDYAKRQELPKIAESYLNFILNGSAADELIKMESGYKTDKSFLAELLSAYQKTYSSPYQIVADSCSDGRQTAESVFYIEIIGKDSSAAEKMALDMQHVLKKYSSEVKETAGNHKLTFVSSAAGVSADSGLQQLQHDKKALLSSNQTALRTMTGAFSKEQMAAYQAAAGLEGEGSQEVLGENASGEDLAKEGQRAGIKYMFFGLVAGIFIYCAIFACRYLFSDVVKSADEMKRIYLFPVYGSIFVEDSRKKERSAKKGHDIFECGKAQTVSRIKLACKKQKTAELCAVSDFLLSAEEKECLQSIAKQLEKWGICMEAVENASMDAAVWESLTEKGNVLLVCMAGRTTHRSIDDAMNFYLENGITVMGSVVFSTSR